MSIKNIVGGIFNGKKTSNGPSGSVSNINIYWKGALHSIPGFEIDGDTHDVIIPFTNHGAGLSFLKDQNKKEIIDSITVSDPFKIDSIVPKMPMAINTGEKVDIHITIKNPNYNYSGPLTIKFGSAANAEIHLELQKVMLNAMGKSIKVSESGEVKRIGKGDIFESSVQMLRAFRKGDTITKVSVNKPFLFVRSEPELPFSIDSDSSFIAIFYIKAPDFDYAGSLEFDIV